MTTIDTDKAARYLPQISGGLNKYISIMGKFNITQVDRDADFQTHFNGFYRIRRNEQFRKSYYNYLEKNKHCDITFEQVITYFNKEFNRIESSFSSKLLATVNPDMPVWDSIVLKNLGLIKPSYNCANRLAENIALYDNIIEWYQSYLCTANAKDILSLFHDIFPYADITNVKKIDLVLWSIRE